MGTAARDQNVEYRFLFGVFGRTYVMVWAGIERGKLRDRDIQLAQKRVEEIAPLFRK
jgi:hypothetical protein